MFFINNHIPSYHTNHVTTYTVGALVAFCRNYHIPSDPLSSVLLMHLVMLSFLLKNLIKDMMKKLDHVHFYYC